MLTKKHFNAIAKILKESKNKKEIINKMTSFCYLQNPNFDEYRFKKACGLSEIECGY